MDSEKNSNTLPQNAIQNGNGMKVDVKKEQNSVTLEQMEEVVDKLRKTKEADLFNQPVDPEREDCPDYFDIIKHPMDLGTIKAKLQQGKYTDSSQVIADINLTWDNAYKYNRRGSYVYKQTRNIHRHYDKLMKEIKSRKSLTEHFDEICDNLSKQKVGETFVHLPNKEENAEYYEAIKNPVSISSIKEKRHKSLEDFRNDFLLLFSNARTFYPKGSQPSTDASKLKRSFERNMKKHFPEFMEKIEKSEAPETMEIDEVPYIDDSRPKRSVSKKTDYNFGESTDSERENNEDPMEIEEKDEKKEENKQVVEKILADRVKEGSDSEYEYYVKWKGRSYLHLDWVTVDKIACDSAGKAKVNRYWQKKIQAPILDTEEKDTEEFFPPEYCEVDRVLAKKEIEDEEGKREALYLVKWKGLGHNEATWEKASDFNDDKKIEEFHKFNTPKQVAEPRKPDPKRWKQLEESPSFKDGNTLRPYQLEGLNWLVFCWHQQRGCILADEMGLGKTVQSISFLQHLKIHENVHGPILVVAPLSTIGHWAREFEEWTDMNVVVYQGNRSNRQAARKWEWYYLNDKGEPISKQLKFNVLLTTFEMILSSDWNELQQIHWRVCVVDEAQRLKNSDSKLIQHLRQFKLDHRVLLTGTPLQNNMQELWTLLNFISPDKFDSQKSFMGEFGQLEDSEHLKRLHAILRPFLLRRMKEDVEKSIPPKEETLIEVELTSLQKQYYRALLEKNRDFLNKGCTQKNAPNLINIMMQLRKVCNHPFLISGVEEKETRDKGVEGFYQALINSCGKMVLLDKLLPKLKAGGHKVLIFSQMMKVLTLLESYLQYRGYFYERLDGSVRGNERQASIDRFCRQDSDRFVFLLCTRAGGLGINLTAADTVIIYDSDWNPQNDIQAQARCHRIGQQKEVKVYRLITAKTYERHMFEKSSKKLGLDQAVLHDMGSSVSKSKALERQEIDNLLKHGAYDLYNTDESSEKKFKEEDIDQILNRSSKVVWDSRDTSEPSTFSKASFQSSSSDSIDINDPNFWKLILPEAKTAERLLKQLEEGKVNDSKSREIFVQDLAELVEEVMTGFHEGRSDKVAVLRSKLSGVFARVKEELVNFTEEQKTSILQWEEDINRPRRERKTISRFGLVPDDKAFKKEEKLDKKRRKDEDSDSETEVKKWTDKDRKKFHSAFMSFGPGRWEDIQKKSRLFHRSIEELKETAQEFIKQCIIHAEETDRKVFIECLETIMSESSNCQEIEVELKPEYTKLIKRKLKTWVRQLKLLSHLNELARETDIEDLEVPRVGKPLTTWWTHEEDRSLLIGVYRHGLGSSEEMKKDPDLTFHKYAHEWQKDEDKDKTGSPQDVKSKEDDEEEEKEDEGEENEEENETAQKLGGKAAKAPSSLPSGWPTNRTLDAHAKFLLEKMKKKSMAEEREKQRQEKIQEREAKKQKQKEERQREWTKREQTDFRLALLLYGPYEWDAIRSSAGLNKTDEQIEEYYEYLIDQSQKVLHPETESDAETEKTPKKVPFEIPSISETMAKKLLKRIHLFQRVRDEVLSHPELEERLEEAKVSDMKEWWSPSVHDVELLKFFAKNGLVSEEWNAEIENETSPLYKNEDGQIEFTKSKQKFYQQITAKEKTLLVHRLQYVSLLVIDPSSVSKRRKEKKRKEAERPKSQRKRRKVEATESKMEVEDTLTTQKAAPTKIYVKDVERDEKGNPVLPFQARGATIVSLGTIIYDRPGFHSKNYIWPVGFKSTRRLQSFSNRDEYDVYTSEILEGESGPIFQVSAAEDDKILQHTTSSGVWVDVLKGIKRKETVSVSGPEMFGFSDPLVKKLIQELPNADKCSNYQWKDYGIQSESSEKLQTSPKLEKIESTPRSSAPPSPQMQTELSPPLHSPPRMSRSPSRSPERDQSLSPPQQSSIEHITRNSSPESPKSSPPTSPPTSPPSSPMSSESDDLEIDDH